MNRLPMIIIRNKLLRGINIFVQLTICTVKRRYGDVARIDGLNKIILKKEQKRKRNPVQKIRRITLDTTAADNSNSQNK